MSDNLSARQIDKLMRSMNRGELLSYLGTPAHSPRVGDITGLKCLHTESPSTLTVNKANVTFFGRETSDFCPGARLARSGRTTVAVPCYSTELSDLTGLCSHCDELWSGYDDNDLLTLNEETMPLAFAEYKQGRQGVLWNSQPIVAASEIFSDQIQTIKDSLAGTKCELDAQWPGRNFRSIAAEVLEKAGVTSPATSQNPPKRLESEQVVLGTCLKGMVKCWLRPCP